VADLLLGPLQRVIVDCAASNGGSSGQCATHPCRLAGACGRACLLAVHEHVAAAVMLWWLQLPLVLLKCVLGALPWWILHPDGRLPFAYYQQHNHGPHSTAGLLQLRYSLRPLEIVVMCLPCLHCLGITVRAGCLLGPVCGLDGGGSIGRLAMLTLAGSVRPQPVLPLVLLVLYCVLDIPVPEGHT
jgi:hypothetical protein